MSTDFTTWAGVCCALFVRQKVSSGLKVPVQLYPVQSYLPISPPGQVYASGGRSGVEYFIFTSLIKINRSRPWLSCRTRFARATCFRLSTPTRSVRRHTSPGLTQFSSRWLRNCVSPGWESNPRMAVLQTAALTTSPPGLVLYAVL